MPKRCREVTRVGLGVLGRGLVWAALCVAVLICVVPLLGVGVLLFRHQGAWSCAGVIDVFRDYERIGILLGNSLSVVGLTTLISLILGAPFGFLLFRTDLPCRRVYLWVCVVCACLPMYITAASWMALLGTEAFVYKTSAAAWIQGMACVPIAALVAGVGFCLADPDLEDATRLDVCSFMSWLRMHAAMSVWGLSLAGLCVAILSLWDITVTDILSIRTFGEEVFTQFLLGAGPSRAIALALPALLLSGIACGAVICLCRRVWAQPVQTSLQGVRVLALGPWRWPLSCLCAGLGLLLLGVPMMSLLRDVGSVSVLLESWRVASRELFYTLRLTPLAATLSLAFSLPAAWALAHAPRLRWGVGAVLLLLLCVPAPVIGIALIHCLNQPVLDFLLYDTWGGVLLAYVLRSLPFTTLVLLPAMLHMPRDLRDACRLEGLTVAAMLSRVVVPMYWRSMAVAWGVGFVLALAELGATFLVVPPGSTTLSVRFFTLIHYGVYPDAAGISLLLLALVALVACGLAALLLPGLGPTTKRSSYES